jgi:hypothetical protein
LEDLDLDLDLDHSSEASNCASPVVDVAGCYR